MKRFAVAVGNLWLCPIRYWLPFTTCMQLHLKIKALRVLSCLSHKQMGKLLFISGAAYGKIESGTTQASRQRENQLADIFKVRSQTLTNGEALCLRIYQTGKGKIALSELDIKEMEEKLNLSEEENKRLRVMLTDSQKVNDQWRDLFKAKGKGKK